MLELNIKYNIGRIGMENKMFFLKKGRGIEFESIIGGKKNAFVCD